MLGVGADPVFTRIHRWPRSMPQYVLGTVERRRVIDRRIDEHPGLALAGAAYRGVGIPDCIASGEAAAERVAARHG
jgi:oxygen-dependent protoporphyrinogen oxidase